MVLFFENNLIKNKIIKIKAPIGIKKAAIKELIYKVTIKIPNGLDKQTKRFKIGTITKNKSIVETNLKILSTLFINLILTPKQYLLFRLLF